MGTRSVTTVVTADTMALNAAIFGFAGHSLVTPQHAIQSVWWTDERIDGKVTREFIVSKLRPNERDQLYRPMFMGSGLTEDTYLDWILRKGKRIFLILVECGVSDQIFGIVEDAWDDDDLPISRGEVQCLALSYKADESLNKKFYNNQFRFLLRPLDMEVHIDYAPNEVIPIEYVHRLAPSAALQKWSRLHLPKRPNQIYVRRKVFLGEQDEVDEELKWKLLQDINTAQTVDHPHIAPVCASWSQKGVGYFMTSFVGEHTLKSFIDFRTPTSMQKVKKQERYTILLEWIHCLAHALTCMHRKRFHHGAISPSNILIDESNNIAFSDIGCLESFQKDKKMEPDEAYNYGAPEFFTESKRASPELLRPATPPSRKFFGHRRQKSSHSNSSEDTSSTFSVDSRGNFTFKPRSNSAETITPLTSRSSELSPPPRLNTKDFSVSPLLNISLEKELKVPGRAPPPPPLVSLPTPSRDGPDKKAGDIYSMACIYLDIISFMLKRKPAEFSKHRSTKHKNLNGKGSHTDSSFHNNMQKVQSWMEILENDLPATQDQALFALPPLFRLIGEMLNPEPHRRPSASEVQDRVYDALISYGGFNITHCTNSVRSPSIASIPSSLATTTLSSGGSRPSMSSVPKIAAFPPLLSPPVPVKSPMRPMTSSSTASTLIPGRLDAPVPRPPLRPRSSSRYDAKSPTKTWGSSTTSLPMKDPFSGMVGVSV